MIDIKATELREEYNKMTDENLLKEAVNNQNNIALDCLIGRYKDVVMPMKAKYSSGVRKSIRKPSSI